MNALDTGLAAVLAPAFRAFLHRDGTMGTLRFCPGETGGEVLLEGTLAEALYAEAAAKTEAFSRTRGRLPETLSVRNLGTFRTAPPKATASGRLSNKIVLVTGAAQGFGKDLSHFFADEDGLLVCVDRNGAGAVAVAEEINRRRGPGSAIGIAADVSDESDVKRMIRETVLAFGGLDVFVSNAGIVRAGGLDEMTLEEFELCVKVNYTGYFLGVKYAQQVMKLQHRFLPEATFDIVQINSKSGLEGSNRNFAYAGSKAGGIGLTKSFALELCPYNIKVNAVCPGNYLDGPLWSDPENGLFLRYLQAGKVPGAKTVEDVRRYYEAKVPMHRGCLPVDVARAVLSCVEQTYETGQAIPVTGGQIMLG